MKTRSLPQTTAALLAGIVSLTVNSGAHAASAQWLATAADSNWNNAANWSAAFPNATNETATFNTPLAGGTIGGVTDPIAIGGATFNLQNIAFTGNAGAYVIGAATDTGSLVLTGAGVSTPSFTNSISMASNVVNAEIIASNISGIFTQFSSTNPGYDFLNNSTTTTATLTLAGTINIAEIHNNLLVPQRSATIQLDGSNMGNNTVSGTIVATNGTLGNAVLQKAGTGIWILTGANNLTSISMTDTSGGEGIQVNAGVLSVQNNAGLGSVVTANRLHTWINNGGTLELANNITLDNSVSLELRNGGTIRSNGSTTANGRINLSAAAGTVATIATVNSSDVFTIGNAANDFTGGIFSLTAVHIAGPGTVLLGQASNYRGNVFIDSGTLEVNNSSGSATGQGNVTVNSGGTLSGGGIIDSSVGTSVTSNSGSFLSPGVAGVSNGVGTLTITRSLDISGAVTSANSQSMLFDLGANTPGNSDLVTLTSGNLSIGTGVLEFDDFNFTSLAGFGAGTYILFATASPANIIGTLGSNLNGQVAGFNTSLALDGIGDVVLNVNPVPEPSTWAMLAAGTASLLALRRRKRAI